MISSRRLTCPSWQGPPTMQSARRAYEAGGASGQGMLVGATVSCVKPGERIPLIKASIDALLPRMDDDATLVLNQFGAQLDGSYGRDTDSRRSFLTWAVQELSDETLLGLHDYLVGD